MRMSFIFTKKRGVRGGGGEDGGGVERYQKSGLSRLLFWNILHREVLNSECHVNCHKPVNY